jgi:SLOG in TRPM, prokaryote
VTPNFTAWFTESGDAIPIAQVERMGDLAATLRAVGLAPPRPVLAIVGGAAATSDEDYERLRPLFREGLAALAEAGRVAVVDGGTDAGVMRLMGEARTAIAATFPLVGVAPAAKVAVPGDAASTGRTLLEPHHTHLVLVPGETWEDGAPWLARVASEIAGNANSVTILVDGGDTSWLDAEASIGAERTVIVVTGSGRVADALAGAMRGETSDTRAQALAASGRLLLADLASGAAAVAAIVARVLRVGR